MTGLQHGADHDGGAGQGQGGQHAVALDMLRLELVTPRGSIGLREKVACLIRELALAGTDPVPLEKIAEAAWGRYRPLDQSFIATAQTTLGHARHRLAIAAPGIGIDWIRFGSGRDVQITLRLTHPVHVIGAAP